MHMASKLYGTVVGSSLVANVLPRGASWIALGMVVLLFGCGSDEVRQSAFDLQQRRQIEQENAAREARVRQEQEELARFREQTRIRSEAARRAEQAENPVVRPLEEGTVEQQPIAEDIAASAALAASDDAAALATRSFYYDYDAYNIKDEYRVVIEA